VALEATSSEKRERIMRLGIVDVGTVVREISPGGGLSATHDVDIDRGLVHSCGTRLVEGVDLKTIRFVHYCPKCEVITEKWENVLEETQAEFQPNQG